jgi:hypothetical protein
MGIEPTLAAWEAAVLPMNYTRLGSLILFELRTTRQSRRNTSRTRLGTAGG